MPPHNINISWDPEIGLACIEAGCNCAGCESLVNHIALVLEIIEEAGEGLV